METEARANANPCDSLFTNQGCLLQSPNSLPGSGSPVSRQGTSYEPWKRLEDLLPLSLYIAGKLRPGPGEVCWASPLALSAVSLPWLPPPFCPPPQKEETGVPLVGPCPSSVLFPGNLFSGQRPLVLRCCHGDHSGSGHIFRMVKDEAPVPSLWETQGCTDRPSDVQTHQAHAKGGQG